MKVGDTLEIVKEFEIFIDGGYRKYNEFLHFKIADIGSANVILEKFPFPLDKTFVEKHFKKI